MMMELCTLRLISNLPPIHANHIQSQLIFPCRTHSPFILKHTRFTSGLSYCVNSPLGSTTTTGETYTTTTPYGTDKPETDGVVTTEDACADEKKEGSDAQASEADKLGTDGGVTVGYTPPEEKKEDSGANLYASVTVGYTPPEEKKEDSGAKLYEADKPETSSVVTVENTTVDEKEEASVTQLNEVPEEGLPDLQLSKFLEDLGVKLDFEENKYSLLAIGGGGLIALWLTSSVVRAIDSVPLFPKVLELVGLGYTIWFTIRFLLFKESREVLVAKFEQVKQEILGSEE